MSFWGVELKPEKVVPFVPPPEQARLHISQACLASVGKKACNNVAVSNNVVDVAAFQSLQYRRTPKLSVEGQGTGWTRTVRVPAFARRARIRKLGSGIGRVHRVDMRGGTPACDW